ncbi:hypothetical protein [Actinomadura alba]|uniref:Uncharacterized protein n=1 Tax=Actinomadura alba TaxID=406431 RepID=A0ABR7LQD6_9ACTN|nr:hypothetical protein [Actinomadura alba]MBC6467063.1 hypothetical protein [Actinomadura alba]
MGRRLNDDRGAAALDYLGVLALVAAVAGALFLAPIPDDIADETRNQICRVLRAGGAVDECDKARTPPVAPVVPQPVAVDPDIPTGACLTSIDNEYLEPSATLGIKRRLEAMADGGSQITVRHNKRADGSDQWQVWDMGWSDGGANASIDKIGPVEVNAGIWATIEGTDTEIYNFGSEKEARAFREQLRDYRIGGANGWAKVAIRTLPPSGLITRMIGGLPVIGDPFEEFMGAKEPDRKPSQEMVDGGLWAGFYNDIGLGKLPFSIVGRDWATASGGVIKDNENGDTTYYLQASNQIMESVELDFEKVLKQLKLDRRIPADLSKAIAELQRRAVQLGGMPVTIPPNLQRVLASDSGAGVGGRHTASRMYGYTIDKNGKPKSFSILNDNQLSWHWRGDAKLGPDALKVAGWYQDSLGGGRWRTTKELDLTNPLDKRVFDGAVQTLAQTPNGAIDAASLLDQMWDAGAGKMSRVNYDYQARTAQPSLSTPLGGLAFEWERNKSNATSAEYFKPGVGWLPWKGCGTR